MEVKLIVVGGKHSGREVPVAGPKFLIGRGEDCHLKPQSDLVSRHHAMIVVEEGRAAIRDFGSKNGTFVNDQRVESERELKTGDRLKIGTLEFDVQLTVSVGGKRKPRVQSIQEAAARTVEAADDELDIIGWLAEDADSLAGTGDADTQPLSATPTIGDDVHDAAATSDKPPTEQPKKKERGAAEKPASGARRLQAAKRPMAADSGSAADETLRQFFGRKQ